MERTSDLKKPMIYLITAMYVAGFIVLNSPITSSYFKFFTPFHLLFNALVLIFFQKDKNIFFYFFCTLIFISGFIIEIVGVKTGKIFGFYQYGSGLGIKFWDVPLTIGLNWLVLIICTGTLIEQLFKRSNNKNVFIVIVKSIFASILLTGLDFLIEPVAIFQDFWHWKLNVIPVQNYIAWFLISFVMQFIFYILSFKKENPLAVWMYLLQILFFGFHWLIIKL